MVSSSTRAFLILGIVPYILAASSVDVVSAEQTCSYDDVECAETKTNILLQSQTQPSKILPADLPPRPDRPPRPSLPSEVGASESTQTQSEKNGYTRTRTRTRTRGAKGSGKGSISRPETTITQVIFKDGTEGNSEEEVVTGSIAVTEGVTYDVNVEILRNDLASSDEYVKSIDIGSTSLGSCNPDGGDYDCTFFDCQKSATFTATSSTAAVNLIFTGHSWDCDCDTQTWECSQESTVAGRTPMKAVARFTLQAKAAPWAPESTPDPDKVPSPCYTYHGSFDGVCTPNNVEVQFGRINGRSWTNVQPNPGGHAQAQAFCNEDPKCLGYGPHYEIDRFYIATGTTTALECEDAANNRCGNGEATNGCYVKFRCGATTPYDSTSTTA